MEENKNLENIVNEETETGEEVTEAVAENTAEAQETEETVTEAEVYAAEPEQIKKGSKIGAVIAVALAVIVVAAAVITSNMEFNKYNKMGYANLSGMTIGDLVESQGADLAEFLEQYGLPADMPADTYLEAADALIPLQKIAELSGMDDFDEFKQAAGLPEDVTGETTFGEFQGNMTLREYVGEDNFDSFKAQYSLGDEITLDSKWKDVRVQVETVTMEQKKEQEKADKEAEKADKKDGKAEADSESEADADTEETAE